MSLKTIAAIAEPLVALFLAYNVYSKCDASTPIVVVFALGQVYTLVTRVREAYTTTYKSLDPASALIGGIIGIAAVIALVMLILGIYIIYKGFKCGTTTQITTVVWIVLQIINYYNYQRIRK